MRFSFEDELTFAPKLNSYSRKIASEIKRTSIYDRRKQPKKEYENEDFIFKPVVSTKSSKIVAKLKTGFFDRQNKHVQKQKEPGRACDRSRGSRHQLWNQDFGRL